MKRDLKTELYVILSVYDNTLFQIPSSVSGTGRARGLTSAGLPGYFPIRPRLPDEYALWHCDPLQYGARPASGGCYSSDSRGSRVV